MTERRSTFHYPDNVVDVGSDEEVAMAVEEDAVAAILKAVSWMVFKCF